jgi:hypothetical protein
MKTLPTLLVAVLIITCSWITPTKSSVCLPASERAAIKTNSGENFSFFRTHRQGKGVTSTWGLIANDGVTDFVVQQTYEDPADPYAYWSDLATIPCNGDRSFKYTDATVYPGFVSYRIVAINGLAVVDVTNVSTVHIVQH